MLTDEESQTQEGAQGAGEGKAWHALSRVEEFRAGRGPPLLVLSRSGHVAGKRL